MGRTAARRGFVWFEWVNRYQRCSDPERSVIRLSGVLTGDLERVYQEGIPEAILAEAIAQVECKSEDGRLV